MNIQLTKIFHRIPICCLLFCWLFSFSSVAQEQVRISADSIRLPAETLEEFKTGPHVTETQGNQISGVVRRIFQDRRGNLWFGTQDGLALYDGTSLSYFDIRNAEGRSVTVKDIVEDHDGNIWLGTTGGLTKYDGEYFTNFTKDDGLNSNDVWSLLVDSAGALWIGTFDGACRLDGTTFTPFPIPAATKRDQNKGVWGSKVVWSIMEDRPGNLWFCAEAGVYKYDGKTLSKFSVMNQEHVATIREDRRGNMWFGTRYDGLIRFDGKSFTNVTQQEGLSGAAINDIYEDSSGNIWFPAQRSGVYRYDGTTFDKFFENDGPDGRALFCITQDKDGRMWFGGFLGTYRYDGISLVNVTRDGPW